MMIRIVIAVVAFALALIAARKALASTRMISTRWEDGPDDVAVRQLERALQLLDRSAW